ncbi:bZIP transcription factor TRAB1-like [Euphorbia lathyris]|uniref:bZIP transcription factor TRAB1-like n=1 Tax=Euphorbia lathyris TaxID=212925 RepID=UPI00331364AB
MGTNLNFKNFTNDFSTDAGGGAGNGSRQPNFLLDRQSSVYSLTFDEFQNTMGGVGKDFGSMNMDELLKNIWTAEETQNMVASSSAAQEGLQRQGSLTLPRTLSQKTVDEVWKDISKEYGNGSSNGAAVVPQRQQTLGEMTLEEFLVRAGVVREDAQVNGKVNANGGIFGELARSGNNAVLGMGFQQNRGLGLNNNNNTNQISLQSPILPLNVNGIRSNQAQVQHQHQHQLHQHQHLPQQHQHQQHQHQHQHQQIFPKQPNLGYAAQLPLQTSPAIRAGIMGIGDQGISGGPIQGGGMGMVGLGVATGSPGNQLSSDGITKSNGDTSSVSPVPYVFNEGVRGRRAGGAIEKVVERRQRRMIKNRESAARSRARKQAYTMELETEVARLKAENQELRKKQEEMMEMQKNEVVEVMNQKQVKRHCLRRTQTGPW